MLEIEFGNICRGYNNLGNIFILSTLMLPSQETGRVPHLCRSSLNRVTIGLRLSLTSLFKEGPILIPRYVISLGNHLKGKPLCGAQPVIAPIGMTSVFNKLTLKPDICPNCCKHSIRHGMVVSMSVKYSRTSSAYSEILCTVPLTLKSLIIEVDLMSSTRGSMAIANRRGLNGHP